MRRKTSTSWIVLSPLLVENSVERQVFRAHASRLAGLLDSDEKAGSLDAALREAHDEASSNDASTALHAALSVLTDLARQRWLIRVADGGEVEVQHPTGDLLSQKREKERIRAQELVKRDEQLCQPSVRKFIEGLEKKSVHNGRFVSIFSLFRDGRELAESLRAVRVLPCAERAGALRQVVDPYLQFVDGSECCEHTGLRLQDIWRYFRHTWTNQYTSTPGRSMAFLVRDRARDVHPVLGIGAIGSPIVQIRERDSWIGWHPEVFLEQARESPTVGLAVWLKRTVQCALGELYVADFFEEGLLTPGDIRMPTEDVVRRLTEFSVGQRRLHHRLASSRDLKRSKKRKAGENTYAHWETRARSHLFRSKRSVLLADLLQSRMIIQEHVSDSPTSEEVRETCRKCPWTACCQEGPTQSEGRPRGNRHGRYYCLRGGRAICRNPRWKARLNVGGESKGHHGISRQVQGSGERDSVLDGGAPDCATISACFPRHDVAVWCWFQPVQSTQDAGA
jgi:hypothetical protein